MIQQHGCLRRYSSAPASFFHAICFFKTDCKMISYLLLILGTPRFSHRRDKTQGYEFSAKLYQAASRYYLSLSFVFYLLTLHIYEPDFMDWPYAFYEPYDSKLSRAVALVPRKFITMQGLRKSITLHLFGSSMFHFSMLHFGRAKDKALERLPKRIAHVKSFNVQRKCRKTFR